MYSSPSYGSPPAELSNNPFIEHPANALTRYPDINSVDNGAESGQYTQWMQQQPSSSFTQNPTGYGGQMYGGGYQQPQLAPQPTGWSPGAGYGQGQQGYGAQQATGRSGFQPTSSFGQQLSAQVNTAYTGVPQQQPPQQQYGGYPASQPSQFGAGYQPAYAQQSPPPQQTPSYLPEFDPYAQGAGQQQQQQSYGGGGQPGFRPPHPREYVQQHKQELEGWDTYAWKQVQNSFDSLKEAWGQRKREIEGRVRAMGGAGLFGGGGYGGYYNGAQQEAARLEQLVKQAETNFDSVAASSFQMHEVFTGYRQSGDLASKRRVREAINAALVSLPDWPPQTY
ncbi:hypothetical protein DAEQUDRAFT_762353 [Daedalea quercina L-15889]|uniref:Uncharacterized protein n=1 Tax=Daedalea quercina L-15889 TaxID=1314783 RepID=A0A165T681_9APHY|nr:hypothetical protein DAEQUDRAFT_762353 [Daedalea quercina L-15889]